MPAAAECRRSDRLEPRLTLWDAQPTGDGSSDPLGLYQVGDALAAQLVPGVRERMVRPRFLTILAISVRVCREVGAAGAPSEVADPRQVFEWRAVEALVRADRRGEGAARALPGRQKVGAALARHLPIDARTYLRKPRDAGFHGVYRTLARALGIERDADGSAELGEAGVRLLAAWEADRQDRRGFAEGIGPGADLLRPWVRVVTKGLAHGSAEWSRLAEHLDPGDIGSQERAVIRELIRETGEGFRRDVYDALATPGDLHDAGEGWFYRRLAGRAACPDGLRTLVHAIDAFEAFGRTVTDAFSAMLEAASRGTLHASDAATLGAVSRCARACPGRCLAAWEALRAFPEQRERYGQRFASLSEPAEWADPVTVLLEHHRAVQRGKGKQVWLDRIDSGRLVALHSREVEEGGVRNDRAYVNRYRTRPLLGFRRDLEGDA